MIEFHVLGLHTSAVLGFTVSVDTVTGTGDCTTDYDGRVALARIGPPLPANSQFFDLSTGWEVSWAGSSGGVTCPGWPLAGFDDWLPRCEAVTLAGTIVVRRGTAAVDLTISGQGLQTSVWLPEAAVILTTKPAQTCRN